LGAADLRAPRTPSDFAIEELPPELLPAAQLKVAEEKFDSDSTRRLYESVEYLPARRAAGRRTYEIRA
jgi:hypothetical protein